MSATAEPWTRNGWVLRGGMLERPTAAGGVERWALEGYDPHEDDPPDTVPRNHVPRLLERPHGGDYFLVELSRLTADNMLAEVRNRALAFGGSFVETGGRLYREGHARAHDGVRIAYAGLPGAGSEHGPSEFVFGKEETDDLPPSFSRCGDWHSEPGFPPNPSEFDLAAWEAGFWGIHPRSYVGLIVTPGPQWGWGDPRFTAWVVNADGDEAVVEPARVAIVD